MKLIHLVLLLLFCFFLSAERKPNVIFILADDLGFKELGELRSKEDKTPFWINWQKRGCVLLVTILVMRCVHPHAMRVNDR